MSGHPGGPGGYDAGFFFLDACLIKYIPAVARHRSSQVTLANVSMLAETARYCVVSEQLVKGVLSWILCSQAAYV